MHPPQIAVSFIHSFFWVIRWHHWNTNSNGIITLHAMGIVLGMQQCNCSLTIHPMHSILMNTSIKRLLHAGRDCSSGITCNRKMWSDMPPLTDPQGRWDPQMFVESVLTSEVRQQLSQERQTFNLGNHIRCRSRADLSLVGKQTNIQWERHK